MAKTESIKLKTIPLSSGRVEYDVMETVNRMEPRVKTVLNEKQVQDLIMEASRLGSKLNVKII